MRGKPGVPMQGGETVCLGSVLSQECSHALECQIADCKQACTHAGLQAGGMPSSYGDHGSRKVIAVADQLHLLSIQ